MTYRKCLPCNGTGVLHGTPKLLVEGLAVSPDNPATMDMSRDDDPRGSYGLEVKCWKCLGAGRVEDTKRPNGDTGASNG